MTDSYVLVDDLPIWGLVGDVVDGTDENRVHYVYTHQQFDIAFNGDRVCCTPTTQSWVNGALTNTHTRRIVQIIEVNLTADNAVPIRPNARLSFTYGVNWIETTVGFDERFDKYLDNDFFEHEVHLTQLHATEPQPAHV
jgi:transmembrane 9 superfamily member 3